MLLPATACRNYQKPQPTTCCMVGRCIFTHTLVARHMIDVMSSFFDRRLLRSILARRRRVNRLRIYIRRKHGRWREWRTILRSTSRTLFPMAPQAGVKLFAIGNLCAEYVISPRSSCRCVVWYSAFARGIRRGSTAPVNERFSKHPRLTHRAEHNSSARSLKWMNGLNMEMSSHSMMVFGRRESWKRVEDLHSRTGRILLSFYVRMTNGNWRALALLVRGTLCVEKAGTIFAGEV